MAREEGCECSFGEEHELGPEGGGLLEESDHARDDFCTSSGKVVWAQLSCRYSESPWHDEDAVQANCRGLRCLAREQVEGSTRLNNVQDQVLSVTKLLLMIIGSGMLRDPTLACAQSIKIMYQVSTGQHQRYFARNFIQTL